MEKNLKTMEALLRHSTLGIHILFNNAMIAKVLKETKGDQDFLNFNKMKKVQDCMTELIAKKTYFDKINYLHQLDSDSYEMLVRTYFHIVENTMRASNSLSH